jgi:hypothetical protein
VSAFIVCAVPGTIITMVPTFSRFLLVDILRNSGIVRPNYEYITTENQKSICHSELQRVPGSCEGDNSADSEWSGELEAKRCLYQVGYPGTATVTLASRIGTYPPVLGEVRLAIDPCVSYKDFFIFCIVHAVRVSLTGVAPRGFI